MLLSQYEKLSGILEQASDWWLSSADRSDLRIQRTEDGWFFVWACRQVLVKRLHCETERPQLGGKALHRLGIPISLPAVLQAVQWLLARLVLFKQKMHNLHAMLKGPTLLSSRRCRSRTHQLANKTRRRYQRRKTSSLLRPKQLRD